MNNKVLIFSLVLVFLSLVLGYILGALDFFGFLTGQHTLNFVYLGLAFLCWHLTGLILFIINLDDTHHESTYLAASIAFGVIFFVFNHHYLAALLATCSYFGFQLVTSKMLENRAAKFLRFSTREIVFPVIRRSFLFLLAIFVIIGFFQGQEKTRNKGIVTPYMVQAAAKPFIPMLNKQLSAQFERRVQLELGVLGSYELPTTSADVDLTPVIKQQSPEIALYINRRLGWFLPLIPFVFAGLVFVLISPLVAFSEILFLPIIRLLIASLIRSKVIVVAEEDVKREVLRI